MASTVARYARHSQSYRRKSKVSELNQTQVNSIESNSIEPNLWIKSIRFHTATLQDCLDCFHGLFFSPNEAGDYEERYFRLEGIEMRHGYIYTSICLLSVIEYKLANQVFRCWADGGFEIFKTVRNRFFLVSLSQRLFVHTALMCLCSQINIRSTPREKTHWKGRLPAPLKFTSIGFDWLHWAHGIDLNKWHRLIASPTLHQGVWILTNWHQPLHQLLKRFKRLFRCRHSPR